MIRYTLLSLSLFACSSFDAQENAKEPSNSSYKIIDASDSINVDPEQNDFTTPNSVVMTIPELGLEVIEEESEVDVQPDSETPGMLDYEETEEACLSRVRWLAQLAMISSAAAASEHDSVIGFANS